MENRDEKIWEKDKENLKTLKCYIILSVNLIIMYTLVLFKIFGFTKVPTKSMEPTIRAKSVVVQVRIKEDDVIERGDICSFKRDGLKYVKKTKSNLGKRVIGLPGETVTIKDGYVYINGEMLDESSYIENGITDNIFNKEWVLGDDEYFMMGDNRKNSKDSRMFGPVKREKIIYKLVYIIYPFSDIGFLK